MGKKTENQSETTDPAKFEIPKLAQQLGIVDDEIDKDPSYRERINEVLDHLPPELVANIHARMKTEFEAKNASIVQFIARNQISGAEQKLLFSLLDGRTVVQHSQIANISVNTARTHMRRLLEKTDSKGQLDLVQKIHSLRNQ